jgi:hypothetical protein
MNRITCIHCDSPDVTRAKIGLVIFLIAFGCFILVVFHFSDLRLDTPRGIGNVVVGVFAIVYGLIIWRRGEYRCKACGRLFRSRTARN